MAGKESVKNIICIGLVDLKIQKHERIFSETSKLRSTSLGLLYLGNDLATAL